MTYDADALMARALDEARAALDHDDVPIGAVIAHLETGAVVAARHNERERLGDPTAHAEILVLSDAARALGQWRLDQHVLVVTVEPCAMCAGAAVAARVPEVVFGAADPKAGAARKPLPPGDRPAPQPRAPRRTRVRAEESAKLLRSFFAARRS